MTACLSPLSPLKDNRYNDALLPAKSSPLKRSDGIMNLDQANLGSPVAKRRSIYGSFAHSFNIFEDQTAARLFEVNHDVKPTDSPCKSRGSPFSSPVAKRLSLRKSTLQQRYSDRPSLSKARFGSDHLSDHSMLKPPSPKSRPRRSLDMASSTSMAGGQENRSPPYTNAPAQLVLTIPPHNTNRHPLAQSPLCTIPSPNVPSATRNDQQVRFDHHLPKPVFSKSLPVGVPRPGNRASAAREHNDDSESFSTPIAPAAKPLRAAFLSTGLISKRNRKSEAGQGPMDFKAPDTPSKKVVNSFPALSSPAPSSSVIQAKVAPPEFGTCSTPFGPHSSRPMRQSFGKGVSIFGSSLGQGNLTRRSSFLSIDGESEPESPTVPELGSQSSMEDLLLTPTKTSHNSSNGPNAVRPKSKSNSLRSSLFGRRTSIGPDTFASSPPVAKDEAAKPESQTSPCEKRSRYLPHTLQDGSCTPPDPGRLSVSVRKHGQKDLNSSSLWTNPSTPSPHRNSVHVGNQRRVITPVNPTFTEEVDAALSAKFTKVELCGIGEFSLVYKVTQAADPTERQSYFTMGYGSKAARTPLRDQVYAVKRTKNPLTGVRERKRKMREVEILASLGKADHIIELIDTWEVNNHLYIQMEYCEEGSLDTFLADVGDRARLDDFRIWKMLLELTLGVKHIHDSGFIHLDLKPANVFIDFEGVLKIGDFGMATEWPAKPGMGDEGDREYLAPESLLGRFDKPCDIFALGIIMFEIASNTQPPDYGDTWQKLRSGGFSELPSLTFSTDSSIIRDSSGVPVRSESGKLVLPTNSLDTLQFEPSTYDVVDYAIEPTSDMNSYSELMEPKTDFHQFNRRHELVQPPQFMLDRSDSQALDNIVNWMLAPLPEDRPTADQLLATHGVEWVQRRRRAGAAIFEGNWGPADDVLAEDAEMPDAP